MRILHTISTLDVRAGGPVVALAGLVAAQAQAGLDVTILAMFAPGDDPSGGQTLRNQGINVQLAGPAIGKLARHPMLPNRVRQHVAEADVIHIHGVWEEIVHQAATTSRRAGKPYVITPHGMLTPWSLRQKPWKKRLYMAWRLRKNLTGAAALHYITERERGLCRPLNLKSSTLVEPIGIDLEEFRELPPPGSFRQRYAELAGKPLVLFLGRIHPGKGLEHLVPAMASVGVSHSMLAVVGPDSGGYRAAIEEEVRRLGLQRRVVFTGPLNGADRIAALADADVFCLPSDHENFGLAVVESLASGTPVVISHEVAISREVEAAQAGVAVERDPEVIARELTRFLSDRPYRDAAAGRSRPFVSNSYDWKKIATRWTEHYRALVGR